MDNLLTKRNILIISTLYVVVFGLTVMFGTSCYDYQWCNNGLWFLIEILAPLAPVFLLSLITYKMREEVFEVWKSFALWFVPVIIVLTLLMGGSGPSGGVGGAISNWINNIIIGALYISFVIISLYKIIHTNKLIKGK